MSQPSRPQAHGPAQRRRRQHRIEAVLPLEERCLLAPVLAISPILAASAAAPAGATPLPANTSLTNVTVTEGTADTGFLTAAPFDSVSQLTPISSFGGDIVRIRSGPGGVFGNDVYAISRGGGENLVDQSTPNSKQAIDNNTTPPTVTTPVINRPGVIYRVNPATGQTNVFFDLNTVISQIDANKTTTAANSVGASTGLVNWYDITFDPEGYFDGKPSMFVTSVDRLDPAKNAIYQIAPDGTLMGIFANFTSGFSASKLNVNPSAIVVAPPEDQSFLRGLLAGGGVSSTGGAFSVLYFNANAYTPGQDISTASVTKLPTGVEQTGIGEPITAAQTPPLVPTTTVTSTSGVSTVTNTAYTGPVTGLTAANPDYASRVYGTFTDFGTPAAAGIPAVPGLSGVQGINGELLIGSGTSTVTNGVATAVVPPVGLISTTPQPTTISNVSTNSLIADQYGAVPSPIRRFEDISFDQYGYFAQGANLGAAAATTTGVSSTAAGSTIGTGAGGGIGSGLGQAAGATYVIVNNVLTRPGITLPPASAGDLFVADLGTGLSVSVPVPAPPAPPTGVTAPVADSVRVPVQGPETVSIDNSQPYFLADGVTPNPNYNVPTITITPTEVGLGGRVVRITPNGVVSDFATNFHTSNAIDSSGFYQSSLSLTFSADGTTLYVADDDGIWQFKTVASLAGATSGSLIGLNDLRSLGVPYDGQGSAVAVIDTGVDAFSAPFRGRVAPGANVYIGGNGNTDTAVSGTFTSTITAGSSSGTTGGAATAQPAPLPSTDGHGTPVAGVVAQFVPQATLVPVDIFAPFLAPSTTTTTTTTGATGTTGGVAVPAAATNALSDANYLYEGLNYVAQHPFVNDPVRPGVEDRVIATVMGFGSTTTFDSETGAYRQFPQVFIALKDEMKKFRSLGIAPIAAAGQFGEPFLAGASSTTTTTTTGTTSTPTLTGTNNSQNSSVGDINGIAFPAILNEVVSVTGSYSYPFATGPGTSPASPAVQYNQPIGLSGQATVPVLVFGNATTLGGGAVTTSSSTTTTSAALSSLPALLANADFTQYADRILGSANRNVTTDYAAPAIDVPTFRRTISPTTTSTTNAAATIGQDPTDHNAFNDAGTSLSAAEVTGAFALVSSALSYWSNLAKTGVTSDAYLTQPVGVKTLNFGQHTLVDLTAWNNPDGINSILQWTAVPASTANDGTSASTPVQLFGSTQYPSYSRISVSNAIAAIEGYEALNYLINVGALSKLDAAGNGIITASDITSFVNTAVAKGMPTVGAMAYLLGGTARIPTTGAQATLYGENPDQPDVLQRRFNFFDYIADGTLNGSVTIPEYEMLATKLLPSPDEFVINDRQKSSVNGFLVAPTTQRNYSALLHISPRYQFVNANTKLFKKYQNTSPAKFHVARGQTPSTTIYPVLTLFDPTNLPKTSTAPATPTKTTTTTPTPTPTASTGTTSTTPSGTAAQTPVNLTTVTPTTATPTSTSTDTSTSTTVTPTNDATTTTTVPTPTPTSTSTSTSTTTSSSATTGFQPYVSPGSGTYSTTLNSSLGVPTPAGTIAPTASTTASSTTSSSSAQSLLKKLFGISS